MKILAFKSGKGGALAAVDAESGALLFSYEAEKDSFPKNTSATVDTFIDGAEWFSDLPDVLALSGNAGTGLEYASASGAGYFGIGPQAQSVGKKRFFGQMVDFYSSSHERAHLWSAYAMSPFAQGQPCNILLWDDVIGDFYRIDERLEIRHLGRAIEHPCYRFALAYAYADASRSDMTEPPGPDDFGRMMGVASGGDPRASDTEADALIAALLSEGTIRLPQNNDLRGIGHDAPRFRDFAAKLSDEIFRRFRDTAARLLDPGLPLLICGEGALNCVWTTAWRDAGICERIFVSPAAGDAGCAIGTAADAMRHFTGRAKLDWSVYAGQPFQDDVAGVPGLEGAELNFDVIADSLVAGDVIGWASGNCEIGPRALGNRSILAAPFDPQMRARLNRIKGRPLDCPVSPVCLAEDAARHFDGPLPSPHMLYLHQVTDPALGSIRHADGSARVQTVTPNQHPMLYRLLKAFRDRTGTGVLCNTSLNFRGAGFINKTSDLHHFARVAGLDGFVAGIRYYRV
ncbi:carbamoyltransferase C-terminal domain-containing protein [Paracoccus sediminicola]|uniref:carbamoyltransferase C-terminal domain-containing protein n=1 Tax=Paracoccus sediminicola TaxID=3017783 RepID=UPI0022F1395E|nr:carbamoyltransferase C-terminal domain-containing protein [Paracoccus sediminicola]WBU56666.1 hypothetical protein PAF18_14530 [Paracoccus sediminicola]